MSATPAADLTKTYDCKTPGCTREARSSVGRHAYCKPCQAQRGSTVSHIAPQNTLVAKLDALKKLAKRADQADAKARKLPTALAAKAQADGLRREFAQLMREMGEAA